MPRPRRVLAHVLVGLVLTACGSDVPGPDDAASASSPREATAADETTATDQAVASEPGEVADRGPAIDVTFVPHDVGVAWQVEGAALLTTTSGTPMGHLEGWSLDREASDRLAAAVLVDPDGEPFAVTTDGLVPMDEPLPLADGASLQFGEDGAVIADRAGEPATTLPADPTTTWVSATGTVVGVVDGTHWDVEAGAETSVDAGCRVADRHEPESPLLVCDGGTRLGGDTGAITAPEGTTFGWVTVGMTGDEVLATVHGTQGPAVLFGSRAEGKAEVRYDPGVGLFFRSNGDAWVAHLGASSGLDVLTTSGHTERIRDVPAASDAMMWVR